VVRYQRNTKLKTMSVKALGSRVSWL